MVIFRLRHCAFVILPLLFARPAQADESDPVEIRSTSRGSSQSELEDAQRHYKRGIELFKNAVYDAALIEFRRAYELAPSYKVLYNIGQVSRQLDDFASAVEAYKRYLKEGGSSIPASREAEVKAELEKISQWVGKLEVVSSAPDVEITVDDFAVGRVPLASVLVNAGRRKVTATLRGHSPLTRFIDIAGGENAKLTFDFGDDSIRSPKPVSSELPHAIGATSTASSTSSMPREPVARPATPPPAAAATKPETPWLLWGSAALLAAGAVGTGVFALKASNELDDMKTRPITNPADYDGTHTRMLRLAVATDVLTGLAAVTGVVALYITLKTPASEHRIGLGITPSGVQLTRAF